MFKKDIGNRQIWQSQNFLKRPEFVANLVERAGITQDDLVIEIGPGKGIITRQLSSRAGQVIAVEIDKKLAANLRISFQNSPNVQIVEADFLRWQLPREPYKVFSNIPFNMTTDIVRKLTEERNSPQVAYLIMQKNAADRFMGKPKDSQRSILLKPWFEVKIIENIDRKEFFPIPKVDAVLTEFRKRKQPLIEPQNRQWFRDFVVYGYNQWQPTILDASKKVFSPKQRSILGRKLGIREAKPSDLTLAQWLRLFEAFTNYVSYERREIVRGAEKGLEKQQRTLKKWHRTR